MDEDCDPGGVLRARLDAALVEAGRVAGRLLEWSELETDLIERAAATAVFAEKLRVARDAELAGAARAATVLRMSAEVRHLDRQVVDLVARLQTGLGEVSRSARHQRAAQARWRRAGPVA